MNIIQELGLSSFAADGTSEAFILNGLVVVQVPTSHLGVSQDLGGGSLSVQRSYDGGASWEIYTDADGNPATITALNRALPMTFGMETLCRLSLTDSTSPTITAVIVSTKDRPKRG